MSRIGHLADVTSMQRIYDALATNENGVTAILDVKDYDLGTIADWCEENATKEEIEHLFALLDLGEIEIYRSENESPIENESAVDAILLPPFYIVKDRHKTFS